MLRRFALSAIPAVALFALAPDAKAIGPVNIEIVGNAGYASNDLTAGFGGRAGVSIFGFYGGVRGEYFVGQSGVPNTAFNVGNPHLTTFSGELGYGFRIAFLTLRPFVGLGTAISSESGVPTTSQLFVQPGGLVQFKFGLLIFGVEGSALVPTSQTSQSAAVIDGEIGFSF